MLQVVKRTGAQLQVRVPPVQSIRDWGNRLHTLEKDVQAILVQEREEMELRRAEMSAVKVQPRCSSQSPSLRDCTWCRQRWNLC